MSTATQLEALPLEQLIDSALATGRACLTCSFQAEDMAILHLVRQRQPDIPVLFLETGYHFPETYEYRDRMTREWNLNLINLQAATTLQEHESQFGILYQTEPTKCCGLRKVGPLLNGLELYDVWFTGLRREQSETRANLRFAEPQKLPSGREILKVNALADWNWPQVWAYCRDNNIPFLPLYDQGYTSIGCAPCTQKPVDPNDLRSGRWTGKGKRECGIHTFSQEG